MIYFKNPGLIPIEGITTMGVNAKQGGSPLGFFGTGVKYAFATILRLGGSIVVHRGDDIYKFSTRKTKIRDKDFELVTMAKNEEEPVDLGFTTDLGRNWKPWMALREIESNCRDEDGQSSLKPLQSETSCTLIVVDCKELENEYKNLHHFFLTTEPVTKTAGVEFHKKPVDDNRSTFFYRGVKVGEFSRSFPLRVNLLGDFSSSLTEDRTLPAYYAMSALGAELPAVQDEAFLRKILVRDNLENGALLYDVDFDQDFVASSMEWRKVIKEVYENDPLLLSWELVRTLLAEGIITPEERFRPLDMTDLEKSYVESARRYVVDLGYPASDLEGVTVHKAKLGKDVLALYEPLSQRIYLAPTVFDMGAKYVASTMHEEILHAKYNLLDNSREMQNHLFDRLATIMETHYYKRPIGSR